MAKDDRGLSEQIFLEYKTKIYGYMANKGVPPSDMGDVFSEVLLKAVVHESRYDAAKASVSTWVYLITRSVVADYYKKLRDEQLLPEELVADFDIEERIAHEAELESLAAALEQLSERERRIVTLRIYKEMGYREIAHVMELGETNVRVIYLRAIKKLRARMLLDV